MRKLLLMLLALIGAWRAEAQLDARVAKFETDFFVEGDFRKVYGEAVALSERMEVMSAPENRVRVNLYRSLAETMMQVSDPSTATRLEDVRAEIAEMGEAKQLCDALALVAQCTYYISGDAARAMALGADACRVIESLSGVENGVMAFAQMTYGHALMMGGKTEASVETLTQALTTLKASGSKPEWMVSYVYAKRAAAYAMLRKGPEAIADVDASFVALSAVTDADNKMDERDVCLSLHPFGMVVYVYTSCGLFDGAIEAGTALLGFMENLNLQTSYDYAANMQNVGSAYILKKDYKTGMDYLARSKQAYEAYGFVDTSGYRSLMRTIDWVKQQQ